MATDRERTIEMDAGPLADQVLRQLRGILPRLTPAQKAAVANVAARYLELRLSAIGATERQLAQIRVEQQALRATLGSVAEAQAARAWLAMRSVIGELVGLALKVAM